MAIHRVFKINIIKFQTNSVFHDIGTMKLFGLQVTQFDTILGFSFNTFIEYYVIERKIYIIRVGIQLAKCLIL